VKWSAPHLGQCRSDSAKRICAEIDSTNSLTLTWSTFTPTPVITTNLAKSLLTNLLRHHRLADPDTCQMEPHRPQVLVYPCGCHGNRTLWSSPHDGARVKRLPRFVSRPPDSCRGLAARADRLNEAAGMTDTAEDAAKMRPDDDEDSQDEEW
jgi:hypothetical protein